MLYMFQTLLVHHQEQLYKLYMVFGICRYHTCGIGIYQMPRTAYKVAPDGGLIQSETCTTSNGK